MNKKIIPYGRQDINEEDINSVIEVLKSDFLTQGPLVSDFEESFAKYIGSDYAVSVANGTAALHLSVLALGLKKGDKVITSPITFSASANCVRYCDGEVVFADIDPNTYLIDYNNVESLLRENDHGTFKGLILVDFAGRAVNLEKFKKLADKYGLWILEDSCHSPGGFFVDSNNKKQNCGNGQFADLAIFSFHPVKHIATGEGGMITTKNKLLYDKLLELRTHGITKSPSKFENNLEIANSEINQNKYPGWYMELKNLGYNYRLSDINAALGKSQISRAKLNLKKRFSIVKKYNEAFLNKSFIKNKIKFINGHAYHLYVLEVDKRLELYNYLKSKNIITQVHYIPVHIMPYYKKLGYKVGDFPISESYYKQCISLPIFPSLSNNDQEYVINSINEFYNE